MVDKRESMSLQEILEIENDEEILNFKCPETGYLLWPLIRNIFIRTIMNDLFYNRPLISEQRASRPHSMYLSLLKAYAHNAKKGRWLKGPILISASGSHELRNGLYFNRLADDFAFAAMNQSVLLEAFFADWQWPFPRHNERVFIEDPVRVLYTLYGKFFVNPKHAKIAEALVHFVVQRALSLLDWSVSKKRIDFLLAVLAKHIASLPLRKQLYARLFRRTGARILIREEGCYGGSSVINMVARDCGLITAEYQHGSVSAGHDAYNFADVLCASEEYKRVLPQYFLGYGRWWNDQTNVPVTKVNIGNPDRTESLKSVCTSVRDKIDLLVLGDGIETEKYLAICTTLVKHLGTTHRIVFRPHPLERANVLGAYGRNHGAVSIEWEVGICDALKSADIVVSEVSTGLFEAVGLANRIFMWDTLRARFAYPAHPFAVFSDADDLVTKIFDGESGRMDASTAEEFWAPNWKENYLDFLKNVCPGILESQEM